MVTHIPSLLPHSVRSKPQVRLRLGHDHHEVGIMVAILSLTHTHTHTITARYFPNNLFPFIFQYFTLSVSF